MLRKQASEAAAQRRQRDSQDRCKTFLKKIIYILILFSFAFKCSDDICKLDNGIYEVVYDIEYSNYTKSEYEVTDSILRNITFGQNDRYKINWHSDKTFSLVSLDREIDTVSSVEKSLNSLGKPYYEITDCKDGTFDFVYRRNHHITINEGKFIKKIN